MLKEKKETDKSQFQFKQFTLRQENCTMKVGTDGILLGAWADVEEASKVLDIGTGTGLIALMLAQRCQAKIDGVEINQKAWQQASENISSSPWHERVAAFNTSIQDFANDSLTTYDLIISNPPFFSGGTFSADSERNNVRHTVKLPTGDLLIAVQKLLSKDGRFCVVLPMIEGLRFKERAISYGLYCTEITEVFPKTNKAANRLLMKFEKTNKSILESSISVRTSDDQYSPQFIELTKAFYLFM